MIRSWTGQHIPLCRYPPSQRVARKGSLSRCSCSPIGGSAGGCRSASWPDNPLGRWRVDCKQVDRADGTTDELAAAVRTDAIQDILRAVAAPGALVSADKHVRGCRVDVPAAAFAIRPQLQHTISIGRQPTPEQASVRYRPPSWRADPANVRDRRANLWSDASRTDLRGCAPVAGVVRRHGSSIDGSHTRRHSAAWHLVKARPMS